jgi:hypothetical protein
MDDPYSNLLRLLKHSEMQAGSYHPPALGPLTVCHHPDLPVTPPEEIESARLARREIYHVRVVRAPEGWLEMRMQKEEGPHIVWSRAWDGPLIDERVIRIDDFRETVEKVNARYGRGCHVDYTGEEDL